MTTVKKRETVKDLKSAFEIVCAHYEKQITYLSLELEKIQRLLPVVENEIKKFRIEWVERKEDVKEMLRMIKADMKEAKAFFKSNNTKIEKLNGLKEVLLIIEKTFKEKDKL